MSRICDLSGKRPLVGHKVSHSNVKSKRRFYPNLQKKTYFIPELDEYITLKICTKTMRTIDKYGIYNYLKKLEKEGKISIK
ncbi:MAG: 50S ribosomal protein L28 [Chitinophagaceae bacterium]|nr:MAG: 50S ribosomal protein L28 [Chitinophagaceae bacterium]